MKLQVVMIAFAVGAFLAGCNDSPTEPAVPSASSLSGAAKQSAAATTTSGIHTETIDDVLRDPVHPLNWFEIKGDIAYEVTSLPILSRYADEIASSVQGVLRVDDEIDAPVATANIAATIDSKSKEVVDVDAKGVGTFTTSYPVQGMDEDVVLNVRYRVEGSTISVEEMSLQTGGARAVLQ